MVQATLYQPRSWLQLDFFAGHSKLQCKIVTNLWNAETIYLIASAASFLHLRRHCYRKPQLWLKIIIYDRALDRAEASSEPGYSNASFRNEHHSSFKWDDRKKDLEAQTNWEDQGPVCSFVCLFVCSHLHQNREKKKKTHHLKPKKERKKIRHQFPVSSISWKQMGSSSGSASDLCSEESGFESLTSFTFFTLQICRDSVLLNSQRLWAHKYKVSKHFSSQPSKSKTVILI